MKPVSPNKRIQRQAIRLRRQNVMNRHSSGAVMDSVAICMIRNEQDIIEPFLRHTSPLVDLIVVLDNCSTDNSRSIVTEIARELGNIVITDLPDRGYNQSETMTKALQHVQSVVFADFVFFLDADEFLSVDGRAALVKAVADIPPGSVGLMPWKTFVPDATMSERKFIDPLERLKFRRKREEPQYYKAILRLAGGFDPRLTVGQGNHKILNADGKALESQILPNLELLHFPIRSTEQLLAKGVIGWEANQARDDLKSKPAAAYQWKRLHDIAERGENPTSDVLMFEALNYAQKEKVGAIAEHVVPEAHGISRLRRYSDGKSAPADKLIAASRKKTSRMTAPLDLPGGPKGSKTTTDVANAFQGAWHWDFLFLDEPPIRFALERFSPKSVLDLGCGSGLYPALYSHLGASDVLGIDGLELEATVLTSDQYAKADLQEPFEAGRRFDMVVCLEVVEHINPDATETLLDSIAHHAKGQIMFSMAEPGQPGNGHINCQGISNVLAFWARRGWQPDLAATLGLRALSSMSWFRRNIVLLQHTGETAETAAARALRKIGELSYVWYPQSPGQRITAFSEPYPGLESSYGLLLPPVQKAD